MSILIAVVGCEARKAQMDAQRRTWVPDAIRAGFDVRFFLARQEREALPDEVFLDVCDNYQSLPAKVREVSRWAVSEGRYLQMLKTDDDVVIFPTRIIKPQVHYAGWKQEPESKNWCSGIAYWLSLYAMRQVACAELTEQTAEDRWTGEVMKNAGLKVNGVQGIGMVRPKAQPLPVNIVAKLGHFYAAGEFTAAEMPQVYKW